eukprot:3386095-Rhodomonas_salina.1
MSTRWLQHRAVYDQEENVEDRDQQGEEQLHVKRVLRPPTAETAEGHKVDIEIGDLQEHVERVEPAVPFELVRCDHGVDEHELHQDVDRREMQRRRDNGRPRHHDAQNPEDRQGGPPVGALEEHNPPH